MSALSAPGRTVDRLTATPRSLAPLLAALASAMFLAPSTALASEPLVFGSPALIDSQAALGVDDPLIGVSCPSSELCLAVDREGYATISTDPTAAAPTWRAPQRIDSAGDLSGVSCPSSALCAAVDMHGNVVISTDPAAADPTWSAPVSVERHSGLSSVSCPSAALCVAVDLDGNAAISADPAAATPTWEVSQIDRQESRDGHGTRCTASPARRSNCVSPSAEAEALRSPWIPRRLRPFEPAGGHRRNRRPDERLLPVERSVRGGRCGRSHGDHLRSGRGEAQLELPGERRPGRGVEQRVVSVECILYGRRPRR